MEEVFFLRAIGMSCATYIRGPDGMDEAAFAHVIGSWSDRVSQLTYMRILHFVVLVSASLVGHGDLCQGVDVRAAMQQAQKEAYDRMQADTVAGKTSDLFSRKKRTPT